MTFSLQCRHFIFHGVWGSDAFIHTLSYVHNSHCQSHFRIWWWAGRCWGRCWQCGRVLEPSCVALCVTLITPQHDSPEIPSHPTCPCRHVPPRRIPRASNVFWEKKSDVSPKREAPRYEFNQGHHSKGFPMLNSAFWTRLWWHVDCGNQDARMIQKLTRFRS